MSSKGEQPEAISEIQGDIEHTREELKETVDELTAKLDVGARAHSYADRVRGMVLDSDGKPRPEAILAAVGIIGVVILLISRAARR